MRRMIVGLAVLVVVVVGLPAAGSAGRSQPPIDCASNNEVGSEVVTDIDHGFLCVAYEEYKPIAETYRTKLYTLWDGSQKLIAYFDNDDLGFSSGAMCRLPDDTTTTETWVFGWFSKTIVICKAPPAEAPV